MKKKSLGFTLVELLCTLVILALLALLIGQSVVRNIYIAKEDISDTQEKAILNAAEKWAVENSNMFDDIEGTTLSIGLDVVFVLDMSGSMTTVDIPYSGGYISRNRAMIDAVNSAMQILSESVDTRMGIVLYGTSSATFFTLDNYTSTDGNFVYYSGRSGVSSSEITSINKVSEYINTSSTLLKNGVSYTSSQKLHGCTYTQLGIATGANLLLSSTNPENRIPVIILLSDGAPSYGSTSYNDVTVSHNVGACETVGDENSAYYTILSAKNYKEKVKSYYGGTTSLFYTIGFALNEGSYEEVVLNPTDDLVTNLQSSNNSIAKNLSKKLQSDGGSGFSYADKSFVGNFDADELKNIFTNISQEVVEASKITEVCITVEDLYNGGYLSTNDVKLANGQAAGEYVIMSMNEATNQYGFSLAKTEEQKRQCQELLAQQASAS